jgi:hypothetical protein
MDNKLDVELAEYIVKHYYGFMTLIENLAQRHFIGIEKINNTNSIGIKEKLKESLLSSNPDVIKLIKKGHTNFIIDIAKRILSEHANEIKINLCPKCKSLARTPDAKQCPKCFYSWHI